jgi:hypothetical protein
VSSVSLPITGWKHSASCETVLSSESSLAPFHASGLELDTMHVLNLLQTATAAAA